MRKSHIIEAHVRAQLIKHKVTKEGEQLPFFQTELKVKVLILFHFSRFVAQLHVFMFDQKLESIEIFQKYIFLSPTRIACVLLVSLWTCRTIFEFLIYSSTVDIAIEY